MTRNAYRRYLPFVNFGPRPRNYRTNRQYTHNLLDDPLLAQFATQDRRLSTKAVYTYRF